MRLIGFSAGRRACAWVGAVAVVAGASVCLGDTVSVVGTLTAPTTSYISDFSIGTIAGSQLSVAAPVPGFTADFSALGDTDFGVTFRAPVGMAIEFTAPTGFDFVNLGVSFRAGGTSAGIGRFFTNVAAVSVGGSTGEALPATVGAMSLSGPGGDLVTTTANFSGLAGGKTYRFESITVFATLPASYDVAFADVAVSRFQLFVTSSSSGSVGDPGQVIRLVAVPSPAAAAGGAVILGGIAVLGRRRASIV